MFDVPGESVLPLSGHRSDVRGIAKSVVIGEQLDAGTGAGVELFTDNDAFRDAPHV